MTTNLNQLKKLLNTFLMMDVEEVDCFSFIVQHPIFEHSYYMDIQGNLINLLNPIDLEKARKQVRNRIDNCNSALSCIYIMRKSYYLTFLKYAKPYLSNDDFSTLLERAWILSEAPNQDVNVHQKKLIEWFKIADKKKLMDEDEYDTYINLPETITVYRGVGSRSEKDGISWTLDQKKAAWFAQRFEDKHGYIIQGKANKKDILAFFDGRSEKEVIISPKKISQKTKLS